MASTPRWSCGSLMPAPRLVSRRCSASPGSAPMRVCRKCSFGSFAAQSPRPLPLLVRGIEERFVSQSSTWLLVGKAGWLASGTRGRLICQLRQFKPPLCGPPYRRPPAESSHGCYGRRALFQANSHEYRQYEYQYIYTIIFTNTETKLSYIYSNSINYSYLHHLHAINILIFHSASGKYCQMLHLYI